MNNKFAMKGVRVCLESKIILKDPLFNRMAIMGVNPPAFVLNVKKKNPLAILDLEIWEMVKYEINHGAKIVDDFLTDSLKKKFTKCRF